MPSRRLPHPPDLRHLKLQAKTLLKDFRAGQPEAIARLSKLCATSSDVSLSKAQTALAREYGLRSWTQLLHRVAALNFIHGAPAETMPVHAVLQQLIELLPEWTSEPALARCGERAVDALIAGLKHRSPRVRAACAGYFDRHRHARGIEALHQHASDPVPRVRRNIIHSLGCERCNGAPLEAEHVKLVQHACLNDASFKVRREATYLLGNQLADFGARQTLLTLLNGETNPELRAMARLGLSNHARAMLARKPEGAVREILGTPLLVEEQIARGAPRMLFYALAALPGLAHSGPLLSDWMRLIIKDGFVASVTVVEQKSLLTPAQYDI